MAIALMPLLLLPLTIGMALHRRRRVQEARRGAAEAEEARRQQAEAQTVRDIEEHGFPAIVSQEEEELRLGLVQTDARSQEAQAAAGKLEQRRATVHEHVVGDRSTVWTACGAVLFLVIWFLAFRNLVAMDRQMFVALGYEPALIEPMSRLVALSVSVVGIILADLIGVTHILPLVGRLHPTWRRVIAVYAAAAFVFGIAQLPRIAENRSSSIEQHLVQLQANRVALASRPAPDPAALAQVDGEIRLVTEQLAAARSTDRKLVVAVAVVEAMCSWGLVIAAGLLVLGVVGVQARRARAGANTLEMERSEITQELYSRLVRLGLRARVPIERIHRELDRRFRGGQGDPRTDPLGGGADWGGAPEAPADGAVPDGEAPGGPGVGRSGVIPGGVNDPGGEPGQRESTPPPTAGAGDPEGWSDL